MKKPIRPWRKVPRPKVKHMTVQRLYDEGYVQRGCFTVQGYIIRSKD